MENSHIVSQYDNKLSQLKSGILDMGKLVISQVREATDALENYQADVVDHLIATDRKINGMDKEIYSRAERLIALRQPMALDLRQTLSPINIAGELERIGDYAKSTAKRARILAEQSSDPELLKMTKQMSDEVLSMLEDVLLAYDNMDTELAAKVRARDKLVDKINKNVFATAVLMIEKAPETAESCVHMILLARGFERVGDHVVNITRHVHQIVTGDDLKAAD